MERCQFCRQPRKQSKFTYDGFVAEADDPFQNKTDPDWTRHYHASNARTCSADSKGAQIVIGAKVKLGKGVAGKVYKAGRVGHVRSVVHSYRRWHYEDHHISYVTVRFRGGGQATFRAFNLIVQ